MPLVRPPSISSSAIFDLISSTCSQDTNPSLSTSIPRPSFFLVLFLAVSLLPRRQHSSFLRYRQDHSSLPSSIPRSVSFLAAVLRGLPPSVRSRASFPTLKIHSSFLAVNVIPSSPLLFVLPHGQYCSFLAVNVLPFSPSRDALPSRKRSSFPSLQCSCQPPLLLSICPDCRSIFSIDNRFPQPNLSPLAAILDQIRNEDLFTMHDTFRSPPSVAIRGCPYPWSLINYVGCAQRRS